MLENAGIWNSKSNRKVRGICRAISLICKVFESRLWQISRDFTIYQGTSLIYFWMLNINISVNPLESILFIAIQDIHSDKLRTPNFLNSVWKNYMTEFGQYLLMKLIKEPVIYRMAGDVFEKNERRRPRVACIVRIRVSTFQIFRLRQFSRPRGAIPEAAGEALRVFKWPHYRTRGADWQVL